MLGAIAAGALTGLAGIPHCAGMCGPLAIFGCSRGSAKEAPFELLRYQLGRATSYTLLGAVAGGVGSSVLRLLDARWPSAVLSWALALALGATAVRLWRSGSTAGRARASAPIVLGRAARAPTFGARLLARAPRDPLLLGFLTALLPCGLLASALLVAAGTGAAWSGAFAMLAFSLTSGVALAGSVLIASRARLVGHRGVSRALAVGLALGAVVLVARPIPALLDRPPACHVHAG